MVCSTTFGSPDLPYPVNPFDNSLINDFGNYRILKKKQICQMYPLARQWRNFKESFDGILHVKFRINVKKYNINYQRAQMN